MMAKINISFVEQFDQAWLNQFRHEGYTSSAQKLEYGLIEKGIRLPFKLYFKYKLPVNMNPAQFEDQLRHVWGRILFDSNKRSLPFFDIDEKTFAELKSSRPQTEKSLKEWVKNIKENNSELSKIQVFNNESMLALVDGACYGFGPLEIEYFIDNIRTGQKLEKRSDRPNLVKLEEFLGSNVNYGISPQNLNQIVDTIELQKRLYPHNFEKGTYRAKELATDLLGRQDPTGFLTFQMQKEYD